nr:PhoU domain-containing protein [Ornithinibacillus caprae]
MLYYTNEYISSGEKETKNQLYLLEDQVDDLDEKIEQHIIELLMIKQPEVNYMKLFLCLLRAIKDLERIGDQTINFVNMVDRISEQPQVFKNAISKMNTTHTKMLQSCWEGIQKRERSLLDDCILMDEQIDYLHIKTNELIVDAMDEHSIESSNGTKMIVMIRFLERLGDNIVNVCETYIDYFYK